MAKRRRVRKVKSVYVNGVRRGEFVCYGTNLEGEQVVQYERHGEYWIVLASMCQLKDEEVTP